MVKNLSKIYFLLVIVCFYLLMCSFGRITFDDFSKRSDNITNQVLADEDIVYWTDDGIRDNGFAGGTGAENDPYLIETPGQLAYLSYQVYNSNISSNYSNVYFKQISDLDFSGYYWQPIGIYYDRDNNYNPSYFAGSYDGGNFIIRGINTPAGSTNAYSYQGVFGYFPSNHSIKNIILKDSLIQGYQYVGGIVGYSKGGGKSYQALVENCYNYGNVIGSSNIGGIVGYCERYTKIEDCQNFGIVQGNSFSGGIAGNFYYECTMLGCMNYGEIISNSTAGGVCGYADQSYLTNCYNFVNITGFGGDIGGIVGREAWSCILTNCYNLGNVEGKSYVGGLIGNVNFDVELKNCYNFGDINNTGNNTGGIIGYAQADIVTIKNCFNMGDVNGINYVGGMIGYAGRVEMLSEIKLNISSSYVEAKIVGENYVGGLIGSTNIDSYITDCGVNAIINTSSNTYSNGLVGKADTIEIANVYFIGQFLDANDNPLLLNNFVSTFNNCKIIDSYIISNEGLQNEFKTKEDTNGFVNWVTVPSINGGNPIQKSLYHIGNLD